MSKNDTVSKEYLLAEIDDLADEFSEVDENGLHSERWCGILDAKWIIVNAPFVSDRPQEWIPCSERLPKIGQKVLASTKKTVFTQVFKGYHSDPKRWAWENNRIKEIEAWQPLPEPWKGANDE